MFGKGRERKQSRVRRDLISIKTSSHFNPFGAVI